MKPASRGIAPLVLLALNCLVSLYWAGDDLTREALTLDSFTERLGTVLIAGGSLLWLVRHRSHVRTEEARADRMMSALSDDDDILWEATLDGLVSYVSPGIAQVLGFQPSEVVGRNMDTVLAPRERARAKELFHTSWLAGQGWQDEYYAMRTKDGREVPMLGTAVAHIGARGEIKGFTGSLRRPGNSSVARREREAVQTRVRDVIESRLIHMVFQPIIDGGSGQIVGAEALSRFPHDPTVPVDQWFSDAVSAGLGVELELLAAEEALTDAARLPFIGYVSVNASPATLQSGRLHRLIDESGWDPRRLVIEITEHVSVDDYDAVSDALTPLRAQGVRLAVDDAGAGYASFQHILRLRPDFIKLDRGLVGGVDRERTTRALLAAVATFADEVGAAVIAEGVETAGELHACTSLGVGFAQGYLIARPSAAGPSWGAGVGGALAGVRCD